MKADNDITVSVVIPVYNAADYLPKCLDSVLNQSFDKWELIIVDDASTDASYDIARQYAKKDQRINILRQPHNSGAAASRYYGLQYAKEKFVAFIDADDWISEDYMKNLLTPIIDDPLIDISIGGWVREHKNINTYPLKKREVGYISLQEARYELVAGNFWDDPLWGKIYRRELFQGMPSHQICIIGEDLADNWYLFNKAATIYYSPTTDYHHVINPHSIVQRFQPTDNLPYLDILSDIYDDPQSKDDESLQSLLLFRILQTYTDTMRGLLLWSEPVPWEAINTYYLKLKAKIERALTILPQSTLKKVYGERFLVAPKETADTYNDLLKKIKRDIESGKKVYIYGAGLYGSRLARILKKYAIGFTGFVIGKKFSMGASPDAEHPVLYIDSLQDVDSSVLLVGMGVFNVLSIESSLKEYSFSDILFW